MKKISILLALLFLACLASPKAEAYVTPTDRPENKFNEGFYVNVHTLNGDIYTQLPDRKRSQYYISIYDGRGNFIGGNYTEGSELKAEYDDRKPRINLREQVDYVAKVEGEGIQTTYQVFQYEPFRDIALDVLTAYTHIQDGVLYGGYSLEKDGRVVREGDELDTLILPGQYTATYEDYADAVEWKINPGQRVLRYELPDRKPQIAVHFDTRYQEWDPVVLYDANGRVVQSSLSGYALKPGQYTVTQEGLTYDFTVDALNSNQQREIFLKPIREQQPYVQFNFPMPIYEVDVTIQDETGQQVYANDRYTYEAITLPKGRYTATFTGENIYPRTYTFSYSGAREKLELYINLTEKKEAVTVKLLNTSNVNVASAQVELVHNQTGKVHYGLSNQRLDEWAFKKVEPGTYTLRFLASGHRLFEREVIVQRGTTVEVPVYLQDAHPWYDRFVTFDEPTIVAKNKAWRIKLAAAVDPKRVNADAIYVTDGNGIRLQDIKLAVSQDGKTITVTKTGDYVSGSKYYLYIASALRDVTGKKKVRDTVKPFVIE